MGTFILPAIGMCAVVIGFFADHLLRVRGWLPAYHRSYLPHLVFLLTITTAVLSARRPVPTLQVLATFAGTLVIWLLGVVASVRLSRSAQSDA